MQKFARIDIAFNNAGISHTAAVVDHALNFNYFRDYNPTLGRYIESDPLGLLAGINTYGYVNGNPLTIIDPLGLCCPNDNSADNAPQLMTSLETNLGTAAEVTDWLGEVTDQAQRLYSSSGAFREFNFFTNETVLNSAGGSLPAHPSR